MLLARNFIRTFKTFRYFARQTVEEEKTKKTYRMMEKRRFFEVQIEDMYVQITRNNGIEIIWRFTLFSRQNKTIKIYLNIEHRYGHFTINFLKHIIQFSRVNTMLIMNRNAIYYIIIIVSLFFLLV